VTAIGKSFVPLRPEIAQKVLDQWIGEVNLSDEGSKKSKRRSVLVIETCLYTFSRDVIHGSKITKPDSTDSFFELQDAMTAM
jgi:hypothetical protein